MTVAHMYETLPENLRIWVCYQAEIMGLPGPDSYIMLLIRLEKQRQDLAPIERLKCGSVAA